MDAPCPAAASASTSAWFATTRWAFDALARAFITKHLVRKRQRRPAHSSPGQDSDATVPCETSGEAASASRSPSGVDFSHAATAAASRRSSSDMANGPSEKNSPAMRRQA